MNHLKFVDGSDTEIEGLLMPFNGPIKGKDVTGEYFSPRTQFHLSWYDARPLLYHHGLNAGVKAEPVGRITSIDMVDTGGWMKGELDKANIYYAAVKKLIEEKALGLSSGSVPHLVRKSADGEILEWPVVEGSVTPSPACPGYATVDFATAKAHFKSAGIDVDFDALKAKLDAAAEAELPDSDFAYIDSDGKRHLPINDEAHVRDALARFDQTEFDSDADKEKAKKKILARAQELGVDVSDSDTAAKSASAAGIKSMEGSYEDLIDDLTCLLNPATPFGDGCYTCILATFPTYVIAQRYDYGSDDVDDTFWQVEYSIGDDGDPVLGTATPVEQTYVPAKSYTTESPITLDAQLLSRHAGALSERTKDLGERRIAAGRPLSTSNRASVATAIDRLDGARAALQSTVDASDQLQTAQARAEALRQPDSLQRRLAALDLLIETAPA